MTTVRRAEAPVVQSQVAADRRFGPYVVLAALAAVLAVVTGGVAYAATGVPVGLLLAWRSRHGRAPGVAVRVHEPPARVLEGGRWELVVDLVWSGPAEVDVVLDGVGGHVVLGLPGAAVRADGGTRLRFALEAQRWGRHRLGRLTVRARRPGGMVVHDLVVEVPGVVRVLPAASRLDSLLHPARPRAAAGAHAAPTRGPGTDFADLRPYVPGDRLRDVSWAASARSDDPWVVVHHPERTGTVVLLLDGFVEAGLPAGALDRAARVVWSVARHHLVNGDRVGLVAAGPTPRWLPPVAGRRARWAVLDALLRAEAVTAGRGPRRTPASARRQDEAVPADAFVVGVSPLQSDAFVAAVAHHRRLGRPTAVVGVEVADLLPPADDEVERAARRLWRLEADLRRAKLSRAGVRTLLVTDDVTPAIRALSSLPHRAVRQSA
ncbi:MAG TPA: DUF58 domain-containing protein [Acidimicrobiales bacterium]|nr:DUF58 domain-containing protein [Acidimicrobiales bacterium]